MKTNESLGAADPSRGSSWFRIAITAALAASSAGAQEADPRSFQHRSVEAGAVDHFLEFGRERWAATQEGLFRRGFAVWERIPVPFDPANTLLDATPDGTHLYVIERGWRPWGAFYLDFPHDAPPARLFHSRDRGVTWRGLDLPANLENPVDLDVDPSNGRRLWILDQKTGLFESRDRGESWERFDVPPFGSPPGSEDALHVQIDPHDSTRWFVDTRSGDYRSDDNGRTWRTTAIGNPTFDPHRPGHAWVVDEGIVLKTTNGAATWQRALLDRHGRGDFEGRIVISRFDRDWIAIATREGALVSRDGGSNFEALLLPGVQSGDRVFVEPTVATFDRRGRLLVGTEGRGVFRAARDESLAPLNEGLEATAVSALEVQELEPGGQPRTEHLFYAQVLDGLYWEPATSSRASRQRQGTQRAAFVFDLAVDPLGTMHAVADGFKLACAPTANAGCEEQEIGIWELESSRQGTPLIYGIPGLSFNGVFRSDDQGIEWQRFATMPGLDFTDEPSTVALAVSPDHGDHVTIWDRDETGRGFVRVSMDRAETWITLGEHELEVSILRIPSGRPQRLWAAGRGVFVSDDAGATFSARGFDEQAIRHLEVDSSDADRAWVLLRDELGVWETSNGGVSWNLVEGSDHLRLLDLAVDRHGTLFAGGSGGLYELSFASLPGPARTLQGRFEVRVGFRDPATGASRQGRPVETAPLQGAALLGDSAAFWFFTPDNVELLVKILDGRAINGHFWVFGGVVTDVAYCLEILDTVTGNLFTHCQDEGRQRSIAEVEALPSQTSGQLASMTAASPRTAVSSPPGATDTVARVTGPDEARSEEAEPEEAESEKGEPPEDDLLLEDGSLRVLISFVEPDGSRRQARAVPLTDEAGAFWFFSPGNLEVLFKLVDGQAVNGHYWAFWGSLTTLEFTIEVFNAFEDGPPLWTMTHAAGASTSGAEIEAF